MKRRTVLTGLLVWTLVVAAVSAVTWAVIDAAGQDLLAGGNLVTDAAPAVTATTAAAGPTTGESPRDGRSRRPRPRPTAESTPPPSVTAVPSSQAPHRPPASAETRSTAPRTSAPTGRNRTWEGPPGVVSVRCDGAQISLLSASPSNGYRIEVDKGSQEIEVHFEGSAREYQVKARCSSGTPAFRVESSGDEGGDD